MPVGAGVFLKRGPQRGIPLKRYFAVIGFYSVKAVADRRRHAAYHNKPWWWAFCICKHRWPWTTLNPQKGCWWIFRNFWLQRTFQEWIATKCLKIDQDNLRMKFSALNAHFSSPHVNPIGWRRLSHVNVQKGHPPKRWLCYWYWRV